MVEGFKLVANVVGIPKSPLLVVPSGEAKFPPLGIANPALPLAPGPPLCPPKPPVGITNPPEPLREEAPAASRPFPKLNPPVGAATPLIALGKLVGIAKVDWPVGHENEPVGLENDITPLADETSRAAIEGAAPVIVGGRSDIEPEGGASLGIGPEGAGPDPMAIPAEP